MANIPNAKLSPRIETGILCWYELDTFQLTLTLELTDQDGEEVILGSGDSVTVTFLNENGDTVKTFSVTDLESNTVTLDFDEYITAMFPRGRYTYDVYCCNARRTTIANSNEVRVE